MGPLRAALRYTRKRRAALVALILAIAVLGITAFTSYSNVRGLRRSLGQLQHSGPTFVPQLPFPITCNEPFQEGIQGGSGPPGVAVPVPEAKPQPSAPPPTCHFVSDTGAEFGPELPGDLFGFFGPQFPQLTDEERTAKLDAIRPQLISLVRDGIHAEATSLSPRRVLASRERSAGTLWGVLFTVLFVSTLFGAEWRWGMWKTLLTHEPRRGRVLASKLVAMWLLVAVAYVVALAAVSGVDAVYRLLWGLHGHGGPGWGTLAMGALRALPGLELYATLAAAFAIFLRGSMAGLGGPLLLLVLDGLLLTRYVWLRPFSPTQQVAALLPRIPSTSIVSAMWFGQILSKVVCTHGVGGALQCTEITLRPIPALRASLVLLAWIALACTWAYTMVRTRDVPG